VRGRGIYSGGSSFEGRMPKFNLTATTTQPGRNGQTVGEVTVDVASRDEAMIDGVAELLRGPQFPPEIVQLYAQGMARATDATERLDVQDLILEKFQLQFWCTEAAETEIPRPPIPVTAAPGVPVVSPPQSAFPLPPSLTNLTPRQILRFELKRLRKEMAALLVQKKQIDEKHAGLKDRISECKRLLQVPLTPDHKGAGRRLKNQLRTTAVRAVE
jgi:hypothetical protein